VRTDPDRLIFYCPGWHRRVVFFGFQSRRHALAFMEKMAEIISFSGCKDAQWLAHVLAVQNLLFRNEFRVDVLFNPDLPEETCVFLINLLIDATGAERVENEWIVAYASAAKVETRPGVLEEMDLLVALDAWTWDPIAVVQVMPPATHEEVAESLQYLLSKEREYPLPKRILTKKKPPFFVDGRSAIQPVLDKYGIEHVMRGGKRRKALRKALRYWRKKNFVF